MGFVSINTLSHATLDNMYTNILCKNVGYYRNGIIYDFIGSTAGLKLTPHNVQPDMVENPSVITDEIYQKNLPNILIVSREYYQEQRKSYPITNKKELKKLLKLEFSQTDGVYLINHHQENSSDINVWLFNSNLPKATILLPESFLLSHTINTNELLQQENLLENEIDKKSNALTGDNLINKLLFVTSLNKSTLSVLSSKLINNAGRFCASIGISEKVIKTSSQNELANRLMQGLKQSPLSALFKFKRKSKNEQDSKRLKSIATSALVVFAAYLTLSSAWLLWQQNSLENQLLLQKDTVKQALVIQDKYNKSLEQLHRLTDFTEQQQARSYLWLVLSTVIEDVNIKTLRFNSNNNRYIMIGRTIEPAAPAKGSNVKAPQPFRSTDLLEKLIQQNYVENAKFDSEVRGYGLRESFTVSFLINPNKVKIIDSTLKGEK
jgi:hypothetical protein